MTKADIILRITEKTSINKLEVGIIIESFMEVIKHSMTDGNNIFLRGFGSFIIKKRARKIARNITMNTTVIIPEHYIPQFRPSPEFVEKIKASIKVN
ncbi:MAG TPA: HU family DNA-binding protein [Cytophagaceae bacterium]|nr:HU family DNA-binding protein [Cytophagaceae bacterium]